MTHKIIIKKDYERSDGTSALYLQFFQGKQRKRIPLEIAVPVKMFDEKKQRVRNAHPQAEGYNLLIGKLLADLNKILVNYKMADQEPTLDMVLQDLTNPSLQLNFNVFAEKLLDQQQFENLVLNTVKTG